MSDSHEDTRARRGERFMRPGDKMEIFRKDDTTKHTDHRTIGDYFVSSRKKGVDGLPTLSVTLDNGLVLRSDLERRTETNLDASEHLLVQKGEIAYNMMRMWQGAFGRSEIDGLVSPAYIVLRARENADSLFAEYLFKSKRFLYLFRAYSYGITDDRLRLYFSDFKRIPACFPPLLEQRKIARVLSTWDRAIATTEKLLANSQQQKKALMQQLIIGKKRFPGFTDEWKEVRLGDVGQVVSGGTPDSVNPAYWDGDIPWITPTDITKLRGSVIADTPRKITEKGLEKSSATLLPPGSLVVCTRATVGWMAIIAVEATTNQGFKSIIPKKGYDVTFLYFLVGFFKKLLLRFACGSTFLEVSKKDFCKLAFRIPSHPEQHKIASVLTAADKEIESLQQKLSQLKQEKAALMQQLLTGKRRVKVVE